MIFYIKNKSQVNVFLAKGFHDIGRENATAEIWEIRGKGKQRYFHCHKYGHVA